MNMNTVLSTPLPLNSHSPHEREEDSFTLTSSSKSKTSSSDSNNSAATSTSTPLCENTPRFSPIRVRASGVARERQQRPMKNRTYAHERTHGEFHVHVDVDVDVDQSFDMNNSQSAKSSDANTTVAGTANVDASFRRILLDSSSIAFDCDESRNETSHTECEYETSQGGAGIEANTSANVNVNANNNIPFDVHNDNDDNASDDGPGPGPGPGPRNEETAEEKRLREEAESEELCRALMAEEAMASYNQSTHFLQDHADQYSEEDLAALRAIMAEESPIIVEEHEHGDGDEFYEEGDYESDEELSYDALLDLGERIGDVKQERWAVRAADEIAKLTCKTFCKAMGEGKDENDADVKCLVCQFAYEEGEKVTILPCRHYFHSECVGQWLGAKDFCPYCRQCIVIANDADFAGAEE